MNRRLLFLWPHITEPSGGAWVAYRHVGLLNQNGIEAAIVHEQPGFRYPWMEPGPTMPVVSVEELHVAPGDVFVVPEVAVDSILRLPAGYPVVVFTQNAYLTPWERPANRNRRDSPYHQPNVAAVVTTNQDHLRYLARAFPHLDVRRVFLTVNELMTYDVRRKEPLVAYMPRKNPDHAEEVVGRLKAAGAFDHVEVVAVHGRTLEETADLLARASVFLSFGYPEGWALPPAEAMAAGCVIVGYHGIGAREYWAPGCTHPVEFGHIENYVHTATQVLQQLHDDPAAIHAQGAEAAEFIRTTYPASQEEASVIAVWSWALARTRV